MTKILIDEATVRLVLEALQEVYFGSRSAKHDEAITAVREALAEQPAQQEPVTEAQIVAGARVLNRRMADMCNIDAEDQWKQYGEDFRADARAVLEAAHNIKENT